MTRCKLTKELLALPIRQQQACVPKTVEPVAVLDCVPVNRLHNFQFHQRTNQHEQSRSVSNGYSVGGADFPAESDPSWTQMGFLLKGPSAGCLGNPF